MAEATPRPINARRERTIRKEVMIQATRAHILVGYLPSSIIGFFHGAFQPHLDQMQHAPINDPARHRL
jgi:hypothetical protein